ncbi:MAG: protein kinase domain-containing protein, partial [Planctomycetota bacterium]
GLHQGQVVVQRDEDDAQVDDIYGLQVSTAARIMDLADGGQILCSRAIFDDARAILHGDALEGLAPLVWSNHGPYKFKGVLDAYDVCEVGEEGVAPLTAPPASDKSWPADQDEVPGWRPAVGVVVPESNWTLRERLGSQGLDSQGQPQYRGEFGEVWQARNLADKSEQVFKFCFKREHVPALKREARLLKSLQKHRHPNLVDVYDVTVGHRPPYYLQMEYVDGPPLEDWLQTDPPLAERLEIVAQIADALDTVHAAGIFHRDIKPSNILLTYREDGSLQAKLADFGLGAAEDPDLLQSIYVSRVSGVAGTWDYMAPELRDGHRAGPQSDLYSLGMTLYQLVIGNVRHPLTADWQSQIESDVLREDIGRCIAESPEGRWPGAAELAQALRSHDHRLRERRLEREREEHRRRNKRLRTVTGLVAAFALVMVGFGLWAFHERQQKEAQRADAEQAKAAAIESRERAIRNEAIALRTAHKLAISRGWWLHDDGDPAKALFWQVEALRLLQSLRDQNSDAPLIDTAEINQRIRIQQILNAAPAPRAMFFHDGPVYCVAFSPDGTRMATAGDDHIARIWDLATGELVTPPMETDGQVSCVTFSPDGTRLATAGFGNNARIWDAVTGEPLTPPMEHDEGLGWVAFNSDGTRIVTASYDNTARVWDAATGEAMTPALEHERWVSCAAFSPDDTRVVTTS